MTKIEWTDRTINFVYGCTKVSPACANCYAERMSQRQVNMGNYPPEVVEDWKWTGKIVCDLGAMQRALGGLPKTKPCRVFVCSMSDLFHREVSSGFIARAFRLMGERPHITFQLLTKRAESMAQFAADWTSIEGREWPSNVWAGVTVEDQQRADERIPHLLKVPAPVRFVSMEPLLGPVDFSNVGAEELGVGYDCLRGEMSGCRTEGLDAGPRLGWCIVGAETGQNRRGMRYEWADDLRDQCSAAGVPFFFKKNSEGRSTLDGVEHHEFPETTP